jgi:GH15 family glucan-1,4-alpha-glucosidase
MAGSKHLYKSGIIGNCSFIAHVDMSTNVSWLCLPRFDSSFVFGSLLDKKKGGSFSILPEGKYSSRQYYIENTNILCTEITCKDGKYRVTDFAPRFFLYERYFKPLMMIRKVEPIQGNPRVKVTCNPVTEYGATQLQPAIASNHIDYFGSASPLRLTTNFSVNHIIEEQHTVLNEVKYLVMTYGTPLEAPLKSTVEDFLNRTRYYWQSWIKKTSIGNLYQDSVIRSALVLKIHQYEDTGAIIAASTTSLPEYPGSGRTWDYRYCWLRDAYYILQAFNNIGHFEEMEGYFNFIANISMKEQGRYQPLYGVTGEKKLTEKEIPLEGYLGNKPVRIGNQASEHIQNDVYGQVMISLLPLYTDERFVVEERTDSSRWLSSILGKIEQVIDEKDAGLWEFRDIDGHFCYTFLFQWAGSMAGAKIAKRIGDKKLEARARKLAKKASDKIEACYDPKRKVYQQAIESPYMDASTLQLIMMNYLDPSSQRARDHLKEVEKVLSAPGGLFYRYKHEDDFGTPQSTFLITAFWHVEALACTGRINEARERFEQLLKYTNHLGLLSEDVEASTGSQYGNFPQAYSHVGLMNAAYRISKKLDYPDFL